MATYWENNCSFGLRYVSRYKYLTVSFVFSHLGFWSGNLFLIAPFPAFCLHVLVPFYGDLMYKFKENRFQPPPPKLFYITDRSKAILLLWFHLFYVLESIFCAV